MIVLRRLRKRFNETRTPSVSEQSIAFVSSPKMLSHLLLCLTLLGMALGKFWAQLWFV